MKDNMVIYDIQVIFIELSSIGIILPLWSLPSVILSMLSFYYAWINPDPV